MDFEYFYARDGERFNFLKVPLIFFEEEIFKNLSSEAKLIYSLLLQRISISYKNGWLDENKRVYIIFTIDELMDKMNCAKATAVKILDELDVRKGIGLIERRRMGLGKPNIIYVKDFMSGVQKSELQKSKNYTSEVQNLESRSSKTRILEVQKLDGSYINNNKINYNKNNYSRGQKALGVFSNVFLLDEDIEYLNSKIADLDYYIDKLSSYMKSSGKKYENHKATIYSWYLKDKKIVVTTIK